MWEDSRRSNDEQRLLSLAYNILTNQNFHEFHNGKPMFLAFLINILFSKPQRFLEPKLILFCLNYLRFCEKEFVMDYL